MEISGTCLKPGNHTCLWWFLLKETGGWLLSGSVEWYLFFWMSGTSKFLMAPWVFRHFEASTTSKPAYTDKFIHKPPTTAENPRPKWSKNRCCPRRRPCSNTAATRNRISPDPLAPLASPLRGKSPAWPQKMAGKMPQLLRWEYLCSFVGHYIWIIKNTKIHKTQGNVKNAQQKHRVTKRSFS